jgi:hypothetical protein
MLHRVMLPAIAVILTASVGAPATPHVARFDPSLRLPKSCKAEAKKVVGIWYINLDRDPLQPADQPEKFASGAFDARIPVWVHFKKGQQLVTVSIGASEDAARVDSGSVSTGRMITGETIESVDPPTKCEAYAPPPP